MKRLVYSVFAIFCFAAVSCTEELPVPDYSKDHIVLNVSNSPMTKAAGDNSTDYERQLNRLDCFFYVKDQTDQPCVYYHKAEVNVSGSATIPFYVNDLTLKEIFPSGSLCDVFVIANLPGDPTFEAKTPETTMQALGEYLLDMTEGEYDAIGKPFVMTGHSKVQKGRNSNATANISLKRVASKVTMTVKVPKSIVVKNGNTDVTMFPILEDNEGNEPLKTSFRYGTNKSHLSKAFPEAPENYIWTDKIAYTLSATTETHYMFTCDVPFYTYAREWEKGSDKAAYVTFEMPWGADEDNDGKVEVDEVVKTYYYQILVNGRGRDFVPNAWYDMVVTVGVLGSTVEALPKELDELSYYVLDWTTETSNGEYDTGDRDEEVHLEKFNYLEVPQKHITMDNVPEVVIRYNASHKIGVEFDTKDGKSVEGLPGTTNLSALYINNGSGKPVEAKLQIEVEDELQDIEDKHLATLFTDNNKGSLIFKYTLPSDVYSPAYVFLTIWLDVNGNGEHDDDELLTEDVQITIYPAIYIMGDNSATYSIFINGNYNTNRSGGNNLSYLSINNQRVGKAAGDGSSTYMHVISISAFNKENNSFVYTNNQKKEYIIGDPRERASNKLGVSDQNTTTPQQAASGWIKATDVNGTVRNLQYYYPTATEANSYQVIAPKFRIVSMLAGYSESTPTGAAYRCASYQEYGFPAGRWRLPTTAEILYIVNLQSLGKIQQLFYNGNTYFSATDRVKVNSDNTYVLSTGLGNSNASVRCVYDEWYWGSEREAIKNSSYDNYGGYQFTWGDRKVY